MRVLIVAKRINIARNKLESLVMDMNEDDISKIKKSTNEMIVELKNGDVYKTATEYDTLRGCKCDKIYVQDGFPDDFEDIMVYPLLVFSCLPKSERVVYF